MDFIIESRKHRTEAEMSFLRQQQLQEEMGEDDYDDFEQWEGEDDEEIY